MNLNGRITDDIEQLHSLIVLNLCCNGFSSSLQKSIYSLTFLISFDVSQNNFIGAFGLGMAQGLKIVNVQVITFQACYLKTLQMLPCLKFGSHRGLLCRFSSIGLQESAKLGSFLVFQLFGKIPVELGYLKNLQLLNVMSNQLTGHIPTEVGELTKIEVLELWNNSLSGPLPANLGWNPPLQWLDVSSNSLSHVPMLRRFHLHVQKVRYIVKEVVTTEHVRLNVNHQSALMSEMIPLNPNILCNSGIPLISAQPLEHAIDGATKIRSKVKTKKGGRLKYLLKEKDCA
ncbi:hypothetical protein IFM89_017065 [Coptis chinensis]|uniref:Uncharacterized protein n=1 Tax=Coptis chinensis TaxID=261450 RepID=A0A835MIJ3_9MAGN|nr:hypothetical protein IFM89_017065 [Coptis chinensis]